MTSDEARLLWLSYWQDMIRLHPEQAQMIAVQLARECLCWMDWQALMDWAKDRRAA